MVEIKCGPRSRGHEIIPAVKLVLSPSLQAAKDRAEKSGGPFTPEINKAIQESARQLEGWRGEDNTSQAALRLIRYAAVYGKSYPANATASPKQRMPPIRAVEGESVEGILRTYQALFGSDTDLIKLWVKETINTALAPGAPPPAP